MSNFNTVISRRVKNYMASHSVSQKALAADLQLSQTALCKRLRNQARWQLDDLDRLIQIGVPIGLQVFGAAINEEYAQKETK
nr:MAG TPA: SOS-response transcriptional repressor [Caudoviricetes sp.]